MKRTISSFSISLNTTKKERHIHLIINKFQNIVVEYFHSFQSASLETSLDVSEYHFKKIIMDGLSTVIHIFKICLQLTKNVDSAEHYAQKGICYFVECIDQMNHHCILQNQYSDAFQLCYSKTIGEIYTGNRGGNGYTPINSLVSADVDECSILKSLTHLTKTLIWYENTNMDIDEYMEVIFYHLKKYAYVGNTNSSTNIGIDDICSYIETVQKVCGPSMEYTKYIEFLEEYAKIIERVCGSGGNTRNTNTPTSHKKINKQHVNDKIMFLSVYYTQLEKEDITPKRLAYFFTSAQ